MSPNTVAIELTDEHQRALAAIAAGRSVFLTGKAGTGKSTLLTHMLAQLGDSAMVVAPTGVAALNVGGITIHRLFGYPSTVTVEGVRSGEFEPKRKKLEVLRELRMLVIDEISMVRADLLDCIDESLRKYGPDSSQPFGGVQMVFVGDLYQLPPVVLDGEVEYFVERYGSPFFFGSDALRDFDFELVELSKIYRQHDDDFIQVLNRVRDNTVRDDDFDLLNSRLDKEFKPGSDEFFITLTTTNRKADQVNSSQLEQLESQEFMSAAQIKGDFAESSYPTAVELRFKVGAQVMLLVNDDGMAYVNGSIGVIEQVDQANFSEDHNGPAAAAVWVRLVDTDELVEISPFEWRVSDPIVRSGELGYKYAGSFTQFPFRLAWAITIHKSQGKTFDHVILDLGRGTFADGQLYVALSRCTSLDGLVLHSEIKRRHVLVGNGVKRFLMRGALGDAATTGQRIASVAVHSTGFDRFDRIVEIAIVIFDEAEVVDEIDSLINPLRDTTRGDVHGVSATMVSTAPSFEEAWPLLASRLNGCVMLAFGLDQVQSLIELELAKIGNDSSFGLGVCMRELMKSSFLAACKTQGISLETPIPARVEAMATAQMFRDSGFEIARLSSAPMQCDSSQSSIPRLQRRSTLSMDGTEQRTRDADGRDGGVQVTSYLEGLALVLDDLELSDEEWQKLDNWAGEFYLDADEQASAHAAYVLSLVNAAGRDGVITPTERELISQIARSLRTPQPVLPPLETGSGFGLQPGMYVCFTGAAIDADGSELSREHLEAIADERGLLPVRSVTIKRCDAVIAADSSTMSGKAKKARDLGRPVISVADFLSFATK